GGSQPGGAGQLEQSATADEVRSVAGVVKRRLLHDGHDTEAHVDRGAEVTAIHFPNRTSFRGCRRARFCKIRACPLLMVRYLLGTPSCACWVLGEWARSISCSIRGCLVKRRLRSCRRGVSADPEYRQR